MSEEEGVGLTDLGVTIKRHPIPNDAIIFKSVDSEPEEVLRLEGNGEIYWLGRLVTTDKGLTDALRDVVVRFNPSLVTLTDEEYVESCKVALAELDKEVQRAE